MSRYDFKFGESWLSELGGRSTRPPDKEIAQRDGEMVKIPGMDGSVYVDHGSYNNVEISRDISFVGTAVTPVQEKIESCIDGCAYLHGYQPFEDTDHPGMVTEAQLKNFGDITRKLRILHSAVLKFSRKPFWYSKEGLNELEYSYSAAHAGITLTNPYPANTYPLIRAKLNNTAQASVQVDFDIVINGSTLTFNNLRGSQVEQESIIIDIEKETVYVLGHTSGNKTPLDILINKDYGFFSGNNSISVTRRTASVTALYITPKWRRL